jgi:hypothetical protein
MTGKSNLAQKIPADIALIVFGIDKARKHHASRFGSEAARSAQAAAKTMGLRALRVVSDEQREIARKLPKGTVSPKGRTVVPLVRPALYNKLLAVAGTEDAPPARPTPPPSDAAKNSAAPVDAKSHQFGGGTGLTKGTVVLAKDDPSPVAGWFEASVEHVDGESLTLQWKNWPELPKFTRKLTQVALLHPKATKPC